MNILRTNQLLHLSVFLIFIGRAYQHLFWDAPYRTFFWDEALLKPIVEGLFNRSWQEYVTDLETDTLITTIIRINGYLYLSAAMATLAFLKYKHKLFTTIIFSGGCSLVLLSILLTKEKFYHTAQFFEHTIQFGLPFLLLYYRSKSVDKKMFLFLLNLSIAITFFSHGLYAFGFYPVPGTFVDMVIQILGTDETMSIHLLYIAGILDFAIAILIFVPKTALYILLYAVIWGFLTAMARIVASIDFIFFWQSLHQNLYETIYRLPHGIVPLIAYIIQQKLTKTDDSTIQHAEERIHL
ncbi:hypothetical protein [Aquimarina intermedia]|uniref:Uncharacterized protein n=1 Tax=Aquimarina intermedia TaxID=350814 RepID=A0A5S5C0F1_9FLAO|nr:hypothetical protein [Aquimarina intermedia]TYP72757.1 hypothetical protein BD809_1065 [Aquimarina intermedia]